MRSGEKQCVSRKTAGGREHTAQTLNEWQENMPSLNFIKRIVNR